MATKLSGPYPLRRVLMLTIWSISPVHLTMALRMSLSQSKFLTCSPVLPLASDLGTFSGSTLSDNASVKTAPRTGDCSGD